MITLLYGLVTVAGLVLLVIAGMGALTGPNGLPWAPKVATVGVVLFVGGFAMLLIKLGIYLCR